MNHRLFPVILISAVVSGCATMPMPQSAADYRQSFVQGGFGTKLESYEIKRSYSTVAKTLQKKSKECLDVTLIKTKCVNKNCKEYEAKYTPTVVSTSKKTELHVQWRRTPWDSTFLGSSGEPPANGVYITVLDAEPAGKGKTKITVYGPSLDNLRTVPDAAKRWAAGTNLGCPDLTQPYYY